jgi:hypothetical protein
MFATIFRKSHLKFKVCRYHWSDYFPGINPTNTYYSQTHTSRQNPSDTSVYVSNCFFGDVGSSSSGGALCCTSAAYFLVESTSFFSCVSNSDGGAIYFKNSGSQSVLYEVCVYGCFTAGGAYSRNYQFAYIEVGNVDSNKNYFNYSSISRCVVAHSGSRHTLGLRYGKTFCPSVNISLNKCGYYSAIGCWPTADSDYVTSSLTYSSFADNNATTAGCVLLNRGGTKSEIKSCNILRNTQNSHDLDGTISSSEKLTISDSCILENTANYIFYQYSSSSYAITLSNCTVDKTTNNRNLIIQSTVTKSFIHALNHMSNLLCHAEYDSAGTLTPNIQTPSPSKKQIFCYTCKNFLYPPHLRINLRGLYRVF